ncbi:MAG: hypothetical protein Q8N37_01405 [bacterium]|nr:hypothetical protein [bacterium]
MNKKLITIIIGIALVVGVLMFFVVQLQTSSDTYGLLEPILGVKVFNTSEKHNKSLGIETAKISEEEIKKFNGIIEKIIKAQEEYNSTKKEESLEKVKNLYLPGVFEAHKEESKRLITRYPLEVNDTIGTLKFSLPRIYKNLFDRIGIISLVDFSFSQELDGWPGIILQVFIFKNVNGEWKIEKQQLRDVVIETENEQSGLEATESRLIKQILDSQK